MARSLARGAATAVAALAALAAAGCGDEAEPPAGPAAGSAASSAAPAAPALSVREVVLRTKDGLRLDATYHAVGDPRENVTVLVAHGNGGGRSMRDPLANALTIRGLSVLLLEYRGYGGNPGRPTEPGLARDADAAYRFLVEEAGVPPERLIYFGESLGTAVVADLARRHPPAAVVLRSPFTTYAAIGADAYYPAGEVPIAPGDVFATVDYVADLDVPVTVVWGDADLIVPPAQSRRVADRARQLVEAVVVPGADHNDQVLLDGAELIDAVVRLAERVRR